MQITEANRIRMFTVVMSLQSATINYIGYNYTPAPKAVVFLGSFTIGVCNSYLIKSALDKFFNRLKT